MRNRKGIILAGGTASRLFPLTLAISKQLLPVYDKPMIYYPLSTLMLAGIREILIISTPRDIKDFEELIGDGSKLGLKIEYKVQDKPRGLADAFIIGEEFIGKDNITMILGDNLFYGQKFSKLLQSAYYQEEGATIFGYLVKNPNIYGVVEIDKDGNALSIEEKPKIPKSNYAVPGLYFYDNDVIKIAKNIKPSQRGEIEITAINENYLKRKNLRVEILVLDFQWFDMGSPISLLNAGSFVKSIQEKQGLYVACIEEIAYRRGYINKEQLYKIAEPLLKTDYGKYVYGLANNTETGNIMYEKI